MAPVRNRIADLLERSGLLDARSLQSARLRQEQWGVRLSRAVLDLGLAGEEALTDVLERGLRVPRVRPQEHAPEARALAKVDPAYALQRALLPVALKDNGRTLVLAMADPTDLEAVDHVAARAGVRVQVAIAGELELESAQRRAWPHETRSGSDAFSRAAHGAASVEDPEEITGFKVVDSSGRTVVRHIDDLMQLDAPPPPPEARGELQRGGPAGELREPAAADLLEDLLGGGAAPTTGEFTAEQLERLASLQQNQEKSSRILRALLELAVEKGYFTTPELAQRMRG